MKPIGVDWRIMIAAYLVLSGVWGVLAKIAAHRLEPLVASCVATTCACLTVLCLAMRSVIVRPSLGVATAAVCGILGGLSSFALYTALKQAPASIVLPMSSLYLVITVILSAVFLGEVLHARHYVGIALAIVSVMLLAS
ncbi:MAG: EamA family transporter [Desulfobacterota bacterium]|nr:EamA family transporter [Thermodesulfobacteriota bacterium]